MLSQPCRRRPTARWWAPLVAALTIGCLDDGGFGPLDGGRPDAGQPDMRDGDPPDARPDGLPDAEPDAAAADPCAPLDQPELLDGPTVVDRGPCTDGHAVAWRARPGDRLSVRLIPLDGEGGVAELWWPHPDGAIRADRRPLEDTVGFIWSEPADGAVVRVASPGRWRIAADITPLDGPPLVITGRISGWQRPVTEAGLGDAQPFATTGARVDLLGADDGWLAMGRIAGDGRFELRTEAAEGPARLRLVADVTAGGIAVRVGPDGRLPWAETLAEFDGSADVTLTLDPAGAAAGAWHVARRAADALEAFEPILPAIRSAPPPVRVRWRPGFSEGCGSCFRPGVEPLIELGGRISDPDEWDRAVVVHELGHYLAAVFSRDDSGGGPHDGSPIAPAVAWSEGLATFVASWPDRPVQLDYKLAGVARLDLETMPQPDAFGTADGTVEGAISERLVAALLWDLFDGPATDDDPAALGDRTIFEPIFGALAGPWTDRGAPGIDLIDYLDALWCVAPDAAVVEVIESREVPHAPACRAKSRGLLSVRTRPGGGVVLRSAVDGRLRLSDGAVHRVAAGGSLIWHPPHGAQAGAVLEYAGGRAVVTPNPPPMALPSMLRRAGAWELASAAGDELRVRAAPPRSPSTAPR